MDLKRIVSELERIEGTGTQLISLYIPPGYPAQEIASLLTDEYSKAGNIKSKQTRKNVQAALQRIMQYLKTIDYRIPEKGLVIFAGNVAGEGDSDIILYAVEPPEPVNKIYRCDSKFYLEPLKEMLKPKKSYGVIVLDRKEATLALVRGTKYEIVARLYSLAPGKARAGGQSEKRFERLREIAVHEFFKKVAEMANKYFLRDDLVGIIVGGPGNTKNEFLNQELLHHELRKKILGTVDTGYTDEYGVREAVEAAEDLLKESELVKEKQVFRRFMEDVIKGRNVVYGWKDVVKALEEARAEKVLISEEFNEKTRGYVCPKCGYVSLSLNVCPRDGTPMEEGEVDLRELIENLAEETGAEVFFLSTDTPEGEQFLRGFGGVAAYLRY